MLKDSVCTNLRMADRSELQNEVCQVICEQNPPILWLPRKCTVCFYIFFDFSRVVMENLLIQSQMRSHSRVV